MTDAILVLNAGSSSFKFAVSAAGTGRALPRHLLRGSVELGDARSILTATDVGGRTIATITYAGRMPLLAILRAVLDLFATELPHVTLRGAAHRIVHGGSRFSAPCRVTPELLEVLEDLVPLAPLHEPHNIAPIRALAGSRPDLPQVACFDTAFHHDMPRLAQMFGLPRSFHDAGIRRYGFHGLSYEYVAHRLAADWSDLATGRIVAAHLGSGASLCAMVGGRSVDTTMGFSATDGLLMGTRCGTLDPGVVLHLLHENGLSVDEVSDLLNRRSGLLGVSGLSADMRVLLASGAPEAEEAIALFVRRVVQGIGSLAAGMGGLDGLVFTGGIGAFAAPIRARVVAGLGLFGAALDPVSNAAGAERLTAPGSAIELVAFPTDEEAIAAAHGLAVIGGGAVRRPHASLT